MDESALQKVLKFSAHLRNATDVVLGRSGVVSIDSWTLYEIEEAFSLIVEAEQLTDFHVLPPNHRQHPAIPQIQFLYDILQKIKKLRIVTLPRQTLPREQYITLKCFRNLNSLELSCIPINQLKGLQNLRPILKSLTAHKVCTGLQDLLGKCGADQSTEYSWENLKIAIFSGNPLKTLDDSVHLLKSIKVLDLSYCELYNVSALFCLPIVSKLDLSFNMLTTIPLLSESASLSLVALDLCNNMVMDLNGIEKFSNLEELDLKENFICLEVTLIHLSSLSQLKYLNLLRNPVTCGINYRVHALRCLHSNTKYHLELIFDNSPLEYDERKLIGTQFELVEPVNAGVRLLKFLSGKVTEFIKLPKRQEILSCSRTIEECNESSLLESVEVNVHLSQNLNWKRNLSGSGRAATFVTPTTKEQRRKKSKKNRTRHVSIAEPETPKEDFVDISNVSRKLFSKSSDPIYVDVHSDSRSPVSCEGNSDSHFIYNDNSAVKEPLQSDNLLEEILLTQELDDESQVEIKFPCSSNAELMNKSTMESSMISSTISSICNVIESDPRQPYVELSPILTDDEAIEPDNECFTILGRWEQKLVDKNVTVNSDYALLSFSNYFYKERHTHSRSTLVKMCISSLIGMELLSDNPIKIKLCFNHSNTNLSSRVFTFGEDQYERVKNIVEPIIQKNLTEKKYKCFLMCSRCGGNFSGLMAPAAGGSSYGEDYCRYCGNNRNVLPSNSEMENSIYCTPPCEISDMNNKSEKVVSPNNSEGKVRKHKSQKSNPQSSDSSESFSVCSSEVSHVRRESDLEIISNPSISSIEVLIDQHQILDDDACNADCDVPVSAMVNSDARTPPNFHDSKIVNKIVANSIQDSTAMQESSSSGSMTGSVCTAVDRMSTGPNTPMKNCDESIKSTHSHDKLDEILQISVPSIADESCSEAKILSSSSKSTDTVCHQPQTLKQALAQLPLYDAARKGIILTDTTESYDIEKWIRSLLKGYTGYNWLWWNEHFHHVSKCHFMPTNVITYFDKTLSQVDHRLELYAEVFLFSEDNERLQGLIKANILMEGEEPFLGLAVFSNCSFYVLQITDVENASPQTWLNAKYSCKLLDIEVIYTLINGQGITLKSEEKHILICIADSQLSLVFINFLTGSCISNSSNYKMEHNCQQQENNIIEQITAMDYIPEENDIKLFQIISLMIDSGNILPRFLLITSSYLFLFDADLTWLMAREPSEKYPLLQLCESYRIDDITKVHILSDTIFEIHFYSEGDQPSKDPMLIHATTPEAICQIICTVRNLWKSIFKVEFDIVSESSDFPVIKEILKDSTFAEYLK